MIHCSILISLLYVLYGCSPVHKDMQAVSADAARLQKFRPVFTVVLYSTTVDVVGNHLSGLLLIKKMPDSSIRMVFSNEIGFTFFDFEFAANGDFKVYSIIKKMNRKSVIKTLQHDFELVLMNKITALPASVRKRDGELYFIYPQGKGYSYYITDSAVNTLIKMERASNKKVIVEAIMNNYVNGVPDSIGISHQTFEFNIGLKRIERNAAQ